MVLSAITVSTIPGPSYQEHKDKTVKEFVKRDSQELLELLNKIKSTLPKDSTRDIELSNIIRINLENYMETLSMEFERVKSKENSQIELTKYQIKLGLKIVGILIDTNMLQQFVNNKKVRYIRFILDRYTVELFASASYHKPRITYNKYESKHKSNRGQNINIELDMKLEPVRNNKGVRIQAIDDLYQKLTDHGNTPYSIDGKQFDDFISIFEVMLFQKEKIIDLTTIPEEVFAMINVLYGIDCRLLRENNKDKELVLDIIKYGLALTSFYDKYLMDKVKGNLACENAYNVLSSYKYTIKAMINDLGETAYPLFP